MLRVAVTFLSALALICARAAAYTCSDDGGCEYNGVCSAGACQCFAGWQGPSCGALNLAPTTSAAAALWPAPSARAGAASGWGFSPVFDEADGLWHAFATVACGAAGVVGSGGGESFVAHLTARAAGGPFSLLRMFSPQTTFGPMATRARDGTFVVLFRVNELLADVPVCAGDGPAPAPALPAGADVPARALVSGDPEKGVSIWVAYAARAAGPFAVRRLALEGIGGLHASNPSLAQLADGRWYMAYRYNPPGGSLNAAAVADSFLGAFVSVANVTAGARGDEDPFAFVRANSSIAHMVYHNRGFGYHAFGPLDGSAPWRVSPTGAHAFTLAVAGAPDIALVRRERPLILFDAAGAPVALVNGVQNASAAGQCLSLVQPIAA